MRSRLLAQLGQAQQHRLTLLCAAAGYGKTTLLEQWQPPRAIRLNLTEADNVLAHFKAHLVATLDGVYPKAQARVTALAPEHLAAELLNALATCAGETMVILDGYEHIRQHALVEQAVEYAPPTLHLVIATRHRPPLPLGRLRARGHLLELRTADLAFTPEETAAYLAQSCGVTLADSATLHALTGGWIVALRRAAAWLAEGRPVDEAARRLANDPVLDRYLDAAAFAAEPADVRACLLAAARADTLDVAACDAALLEMLEARNCFIGASNEGVSQRLHPLYTAFLRRRMAARTPDCDPAEAAHEKAEG